MAKFKAGDFIELNGFQFLALYPDTRGEIIRVLNSSYEIGWKSFTYRSIIQTVDIDAHFKLDSSMYGITITSGAQFVAPNFKLGDIIHNLMGGGDCEITQLDYVNCMYTLKSLTGIATGLSCNYTFHYVHSNYVRNMGKAPVSTNVGGYIPKFKKGDRFIVISNGQGGRIIDIGPDEYSIQWDNHVYVLGTLDVYSDIKSCDSIWAHVPSSQAQAFPGSHSYVVQIPDGLTLDCDTLSNGKAPLNNRSQCFHDWKSYQGFNESYEYCTKCDEKKDKKNV